MSVHLSTRVIAVFSIALVHHQALAASWTEQCWLQASSPLEPNNEQAGRTYAQLLPSLAAPACENAVGEAKSMENLYRLGRVYHKLSRYTDASASFAASSNMGYAPADLALAFLYERGEGVSPSLTKALELYTRAAKANIGAAQSSVGRMYYQGRGVPQDYGAAIRWFELASERGDITGLMYLALIYQDGIGVIKNEGRAFRLYSDAASLGWGPAEASVGESYELGLGVTRDIAAAVRFYQRAITKDEPKAQLRLGYLYESGLGVPKDIPQAIKLFERSAGQGFSEAQLKLGTLYHKGEGVQQDYRRALELYGKAAEQGNRVAEFNIGLMHEAGLGTPADRQEALRWYESSSTHGYADAAEAVARLRQPERFSTGEIIIGGIAAAIMLGAALKANRPQTLPDSQSSGGKACNTDTFIIPSEWPCGASYKPVGQWPSKYWCYSDFTSGMGHKEGTTFCTSGGVRHERGGLFDGCVGAEGWCSGGLFE